MGTIRLRPSHASRWSKCTASPGFIDREAARLVEREESYSKEGTEAHALAAKWIEKGEALPSDHKWYQPIKTYVEYVLGLPGTPMVETTVSLFYAPEGKGTIDAFNIAPNYLYVTDLKFGECMLVSPTMNTQTTIYVWSMFTELFDIGILDPAVDYNVNITIVQPRADGEQIKTWLTTSSEIRAVAMELAATAAKILADPHAKDLVFYVDPKKACQFCPAKEICRAYADTMLGSSGKIAARAGYKPQLPPHEALTDEEIRSILEARTALNGWLEKLNAYARTRHETKPIPGMKFVAGSGSRVWKNDQEAADWLKAQGFKADEIVPPGTLISPAAAEKLLKSVESTKAQRDALAPLIKTLEGKPVLVDQDDPKEELKPAKEEFDVLG